MGARTALVAATQNPAPDQSDQDAARHDHDRHAEHGETEARHVFHRLQARPITDGFRLALEALDRGRRGLAHRGPPA